MRHGSDGLLYTASAAPAASPQTSGERRGPATETPPHAAHTAGGCVVVAPWGGNAKPPAPIG